MNFQDAYAEYQRLRQGYESGQLPPEEFARRVQALQVRDANGGYWTIDGRTGGWLFYNGSAWVPAQPPAQGYAPQPGYGAPQGGYSQQGAAGYAAGGATQVATGYPQGGYAGQPGGYAGQPRGQAQGTPAGAAPKPQPSRTRRTLSLIVTAVIVLGVCARLASAASGIRDLTASSGISEAATAKGVDSDNKPTGKTTQLTSFDTVYVTFTARKVQPGQQVLIKLYQDGSPLTLRNPTQRFDESGTYYGYFSYTNMPAGNYKAELYFNDAASPDKTLNFTVK